jgi:hypothetical protein
MAGLQPTASSVEYRAITNFPGYRVGNDGTIWSCWGGAGRGNGRVKQVTNHWKQLKPQAPTNGYRQVSLKTGGARKVKILLVHRLVLEAFVGPCPENMECRHLNGARSDNRLTNLAWGTKVENEADKKKHANYGPRARLHTYGGRTLCLKDWSRILKIPYSCLLETVIPLFAFLRSFFAMRAKEE